MHPLLPALQHKRQIIWDWNGTLLDDLELNVRTMNALLASSQLSPITTEQHREQFRFPVIDYYKDLGFDTSPETFAVLCDDFNERYNSGLKDCNLAPRILEVLEALSASGKTQSILSASRQDALDYAIEHFGLTHIFQHVFGIEHNMASSKLERGRELMGLSHIPHEDTILVGDTGHDLEVGRELGIDVVLVDHGHQSYERLIAAHDHVVKCFAAIHT